MKNPNNSISSDIEIQKISELDQIQKDGYCAFFNGETEESNPHQNGTLAYEYWSDGWQDGYDDENDS